MANKKAIKKKEFDVNALIDEMSSDTKYKPNDFLHCGDAFYEATGMEGPAIGHLNMFIGHSDSGKTAAMIKAIIASQKRGRLPVVIITEEKWAFDHAQLMGMDCNENEDGEWKGFFIFRDDFEYVEQLTDFVNEMIDKQEKGEIPYHLDFFWDSVGTIPCKLTFDGKGGKQHTAGVISDKIGMGLNRRITSTRKASKKYTNTLVALVQPWVDIDMGNPMAKPKLEGKGGRAFYLNSTLVFQFGNIRNAGTSAISATKDGRKIKYATRTKIAVKKNHVNGLGYEDGKIIITPHDFILDTPYNIKKYKDAHNDYWYKILGTEEFDLVHEKEVPSDREDETPQDKIESILTNPSKSDDDTPKS